MGNPYLYLLVHIIAPIMRADIFIYLSSSMVTLG